jgi:hypothetical protein
VGALVDSVLATNPLVSKAQFFLNVRTVEAPCPDYIAASVVVTANHPTYGLLFSGEALVMVPTGSEGATAAAMVSSALTVIDSLWVQN